LERLGLNIARRSPPRPRLEVADIFGAHGPAWRKSNARCSICGCSREAIDLKAHPVRPKRPFEFVDAYGSMLKASLSSREFGRARSINKLHVVIVHFELNQ